MLLEHFINTGAWAWFGLFFFIILLPLGIVVLIVNPKKKFIILYLIVASIPFFVGIIDSFNTPAFEDRIKMKEKKSSTQYIFNKYPLELGLIYSGPLISIGIIGLLINKKKRI